MAERTNVKLIRLRHRADDAHVKMRNAEGTGSYQHRTKIFQQRSRLLERAETNGDRNRDVNEARNRVQTS